MQKRRTLDCNRQGCTRTPGKTARNGETPRSRRNAQVLAEIGEKRTSKSWPERAFALTVGESRLGWFGIGSPEMAGEEGSLRRALRARFCEITENTWSWFLGGNCLNRHYLFGASSAKTNPGLAFRKPSPEYRAAMSLKLAVGDRILHRRDGPRVDHSQQKTPSESQRYVIERRPVRRSSRNNSVRSLAIWRSSRADTGAIAPEDGGGGPQICCRSKLCSAERQTYDFC